MRRLAGRRNSARRRVRPRQSNPRAFARSEYGHVRKIVIAFGLVMPVRSVRSALSAFHDEPGSGAACCSTEGDHRREASKKDSYDNPPAAPLLRPPLSPAAIAEQIVPAR